MLELSGMSAASTLTPAYAVARKDATPRSGLWIWGWEHYEKNKASLYAHDGVMQFLLKGFMVTKNVSFSMYNQTLKKPSYRVLVYTGSMICLVSIILV